MALQSAENFLLCSTGLRRIDCFTAVLPHFTAHMCMLYITVTNGVVVGKARLPALPKFGLSKICPEIFTVS